MNVLKTPLFNLILGMFLGLLFGAAITMHELTLRVEARNKIASEQMDRAQEMFQAEIEHLNESYRDAMANCQSHLRVKKFEARGFSPARHVKTQTIVIDPPVGAPPLGGGVHYVTECNSDGHCITTVERGTVQ